MTNPFQKITDGFVLAFSKKSFIFTSTLLLIGGIFLIQFTPLGTFLNNYVNQFATVYSSTPNSGVFGTNGQVNTILPDPSGGYYIGGSFTYIGTYNGDGLVSSNTGSLSSVFAKANNTINTSVSDGSGGFYIGGLFTQVGTVTRNRIAHILSDGTVDPNFDPNANSTVSTLALSTSTNTLYVGGAFTIIGGVSQSSFAAIDTLTGSLSSTSTNPGANGSVFSSVLSADASKLYIGGFFTQVGPFTGDGTLLSTSTGLVVAGFAKVNGSINTTISDGSGGFYIGGLFTQVGTVTRNRIAHILSDGTVDPNFDPNANSTVSSLLLSTSTNTLYFGGTFTTVGGISRVRLAAVNATNGNLITAFNPSLDSDVVAFALSSDQSRLYIAGNFGAINGISNNGVAALNTSDGSLATSFNFNVNGTGAAIALSSDGNILYAGGNFTTVKTTFTSGAPLSTSTGVITIGNFQKVNNTVNAVLSDGLGGWYIGGAFTAISTTTRNYIAHIFSDGSIDPAFDPNANNTVSTLILSTSTNTLYAGGTFTTVGGITRNHITAVSTIDGSVITSFDPNTNNTVNTMVLSTSTNILYLGGTFTTVGGITRNRIAAVNTSDGSLVSAFDPNANSDVNALTLASSSSILYFGGAFTTIGTTTRTRLAAVNTVDGSLVSAFNSSADNTVNSLALSLDESRLYIGGNFLNLNATGRSRLGAVNTSDGSLVSTITFAQSANGNVKALTLSADGSVIYIGGSFGTVTGANRNNIISALTSNGNLITGFNPNPNSSGNVNAIALSADGDSVYIGGSFSTLGGTTRNRLAAVNTSDGSLVTAFDPSPNSTISTLVLSTSSNILYVGGSFTSIVGTTRNRIAAVNTSDGSLVSAFNPNANSTVLTMAISPSSNILYIGGQFTLIGGATTRNHLAAVSTIDGSLISSFNPNMNNNVNTLALSSDESNIYAGGTFTFANPTNRNNLVAVNTSDGSIVSAFNPNPNSTVNSLVLSSSSDILYLGGSFGSVATTTRNGTAAVNTSDGSIVSAFNPNANNTVSTLVLSTSSNILYLGGSFTTIGSTTRNRIAAVNTSDGSLVSAFDPNANNTVSTLALSSSLNILYLGGSFTSVATTTRNGTAAVNTSDGSIVSAFNPNTVGNILTINLFPDGSSIYIGGSTQLYGGVIRNRVAHILSDGTVDLNFNSDINSNVNTLTLSSSSDILYLGGLFTSVDATTRNRIAAVNTSDGSIVSAFNPNANNTVSTLVLSTSSNILYLGGSFTTIGSTTRNRIAAVNTSDGSLVSAFNPNANSTVLTMAISPSSNILYIGGQFTLIGGATTRNRIAAVNTSDGSLVSAFDPNSNSDVVALKLSLDESTLYIGGGFTILGGIARSHIASVNTSNGVLTGSFINFNNNVSTITLDASSNTLYLGGLFTAVGLVTRNRIAAVNISDGSLVSAFDPNANNTVSASALSLDGNTLYMGGSFTTIGGNIALNFGSFPASVSVTEPIFHHRRSSVLTESGEATTTSSSTASEGTTTATSTVVVATNVTPSVQVSTTPTFDNYVFNINLQRHDISSDVKELQMFLNIYNFILATSSYGSIGNETDYFGPLTQAALIRFQGANNLPATGFFGPLSRSLINEKKYILK